MTQQAPYTDLLGKPFAIGARGPETFDCLGVVLEVLRRLSIPVPRDFALEGYADASEGAQRAFAQTATWKRIGDSAGSAKRLGDIVYTISNDGRAHHVLVLVFAAEPRVALTATKRHGVRAFPLRSVQDVVGVYRSPEVA